VGNAEGRTQNEERGTLSAERGTQTAERPARKAERGRDRRSRLCGCRLVVLSVILIIVSGTPTALGAPTQDEFFRSMQKTREVNPPGVNLPRSRDAMPLVMAAAGLLMLLLVLMAIRQSRLRRQPAAAAVLNSPRKLAREVARRVPLTRREWRQVRAAAGGQGCDSPITLLLCPSLLIKAAQDEPAKLDRRVLTDVARKLIG
jgi:hypothetical protein